ncbi:MAG: hypothetical protein M1840_004446 [Geoglossum simile]|nr:MAG: hypothetical protein M1840_004446 [Geoglossum simile]
MTRPIQRTNGGRWVEAINPSWFRAITLYLLVSPTVASQPQPAELIPWHWSVKPNSTTTFHCPAPRSTLGTFAVVNVVTSTLAVIFGNRKVASVLTAGLFGKERSSSWKFFWLVSLGLQLGANAIVALVIRRTDGFDSTFAVGDLVLFYTTRPRISWLILGFLNIGSVTDGSSQWGAAFRQTVIAEIILQLVAIWYMGGTVRFALKHGYYKLHANFGLQHGGAARMMYGGALFYLVTMISNIPFLYFFVLRNFSRENLELFVAGFITLSCTTSWIGSWLFWAGYVRLAGDL